MTSNLRHCCRQPRGIIDLLASELFIFARYQTCGHRLLAGVQVNYFILTPYIIENTLHAVNKTNSTQLYFLKGVMYQ